MFLVHGMNCYLCGVPLDLTTMAVDHVIPERLLAMPSILESAKSMLGLPASFNLNSFEKRDAGMWLMQREKGSGPIPSVLSYSSGVATSQ